MLLASVANRRGVEHRIDRGQRILRRPPMLGFPFRDPHQTILDSQSVDRRQVQPGREADAPALGSLASRLEHRLLECDRQLLNGHTAMVAPDSYRWVGNDTGDSMRLLRSDGRQLSMTFLW